MVTKPVSRVERDSDTGEEMIFFYRRGRPYLYLRMAKPPRWFIRRLREFEVRTFMVVKYSLEEAKKQNPLYVDAGAYTIVSAEKFMEREEIAKELREPIKRVIDEKFGVAVRRQLLKDAGVEYGSEPYYTTRHDEHKCTVEIVWKHRPDEKAKSQEVEETI